MIEIKVPATTANLGIGFDCLGCALDIYAHFQVELSDELKFEGCPEKYQNKNNLFYTSYTYACEQNGIEPANLHIMIDSDIPVSRGLGSSAAMIVGGIIAANQLHDLHLDKQQVLEIATKIEGHPDNVAPAIYGGFTASFMSDEVVTVSYPIYSRYRFIVLIPNFEVSTHEARQVLPKQISYQDAIHNISRMAAWLRGIETGNDKLLSQAGDDCLHEPYRKKLIHEYEEVKKICLEENASAFLISGSGPTLLAITQEEDFADRIRNNLKELTYHWQIQVCDIDRKGVESCSKIS